jgi:hypothetical protein
MNGTIPETLPQWVQRCITAPLQVDCATTVMLKILDGKCKMNPAEKVVMAALYHACRPRAGALLGDDVHQLIEQASAARAAAGMDDALRLVVYERRLLAETLLSRPVMKAFKAMLRQQGLFALPALQAAASAVQDASGARHAAA